MKDEDRVRLMFGPYKAPLATGDDETETLILRLKQAGWNIGEVATSDYWLVTGTNGENVIHAEGPDPLTAWRRAAEQARSVGMLSYDA